MKISLNWLQDFVDIKEFMQRPEQLAEILTKAGLEVEEIDNKSKAYEFVVTGLILEKGKHPNADKLSVCKVTTGEGVVHQIVCGAQNHQTNDKVVVALPGAVLPGNFAIKKAVVRDVESGGMLCSLKELGLPGESLGIEILPADAPIGKPYAEYKGLGDISFELKVTANRADCLSHYGLAREIATLTGKALKKPWEDNPLTTADASTKKTFGLEVKAPELASRYTGRYLKGVTVGPSPDWLKKRLEAVGMNSINNIVDCTNYVMMEMGQPLHAFDADKVSGQKIVVDTAKGGEKFVTLDGTELTLKGGELMIQDTEKNLCIAGTIGGKNSGVTDPTKNIFLESAYFSPMSVRKSARAHGLNTDSSYRFSRGVDPEGAKRALDRASQLITQVAGGEAFADEYDFYPSPIKKEVVNLSLQTVSDRLGYAAQANIFEDFMTRLGCQIEKAGEVYKILPPSFRFDLEQEMDLVEEYARLNGYEHIPETLPPFPAQPTAHDQNYVLQRRVSETLRAQGFSSAVFSALSGSKSEMGFLKNIKNLNSVGLRTSEMPVKILNPLNEEQDCMRLGLSHTMFKNISMNFRQGNESGRIFEIGKSFFFEGPENYKETWRLSLSAWGQPRGLWVHENAPVVFQIKAAVEKLLASLHIGTYSWVNFEQKGDAPSFIHPGQSAQLVVEGKKVGFIGSLHPVLLAEEKVRVPAAIAELDLDALLKGQPRSYKVESLSKFPKIERDLALVMPKATRVGDVIQAIKKEAGAYLIDTQIFDVYEGDKLEQGKKSVAFRLIFQDKKDTLRDELVNQSTEKVLGALKEKFGLTVR